MHQTNEKLYCTERSRWKKERKKQIVVSKRWKYKNGEELTLTESPDSIQSTTQEVVRKQAKHYEDQKKASEKQLITMNPHTHKTHSQTLNQSLIRRTVTTSSGRVNYLCLPTSSPLSDEFVLSSGGLWVWGSLKRRPCVLLPSGGHSWCTGDTHR